MQLVKGAESLLPKNLIKLNTVTIAVVRATSASPEISQVWNIPGQKGQNWEKKASKIKKKVPFSSYSVSVVCPGTEAGPARVRACLRARNTVLADAQPPGSCTLSLQTRLLPHVLATVWRTPMLVEPEDPWPRSGSWCLESSPVVPTSWARVAGPEAQGL